MYYEKVLNSESENSRMSYINYEFLEEKIERKKNICYTKTAVGSVFYP